jgi:hypothetical protein
MNLITERDERLESPMGGRSGTCLADEADLRRVFGTPVNPCDADGKVTKCWRFNTPRGTADLRDYWWNQPGEWSLSCKDQKSLIWLRRHVASQIDAKFYFRSWHGDGKNRWDLVREWIAKKS